MNQSFVITALAGDRTLVTGYDATGVLHNTILFSEEFNALAARDEESKAVNEFDATVAEFFSPLTDAADRAFAASTPVIDSAFFIVEQEEELGHTAKREVLHRLHRDTVVLRFIASGDTSRLLWLGDTIEILAASTLPATAPAVDVADEQF